MIWKSLATRVKKVLPNLIGARQTANLNERFITESNRLIDDVIKVSDLLKMTKCLSPNSRSRKKLLIH